MSFFQGCQFWYHFFAYLVDLHLRRQTRRRVLLGAPDPDPALAELLLTSSSSKAVFKSWTSASILNSDADLAAEDAAAEFAKLRICNRLMTSFSSVFDLT